MSTPPLGSLALFGTIGTTELIVILVVALLIFGSRLPDVARSMGRSFTQFKRGLRDIEDEVEETSRLDSKRSTPQIPPPNPAPQETAKPVDASQEKRT